MKMFTPRSMFASLGVALCAASGPSPAAAPAQVTLPDPGQMPAGQKQASRPNHPNILIILLDDAGYAQADTVGGEIHTPTLSRIANSGIMYNAFHATAISSATRASLLTGRNNHRVGNGTIVEMSSKNDGYTGVIPTSAATVADILRANGYSTVAFGKWHNTPPDENTPVGPFKHWPTAYGFDHFYGFIGGDTDEYSPSLVNDTTVMDPPHRPGYHLTEDLTRHAVDWLDQHQASSPDKPFFMYWAPGAVHAPHQVFQQWTDKYKGKFDSGWDAYRQRVFERQKKIGWIPQNTENNPRPAEMAAWDSLSPQQKQFQARLMEVYAGYLEHTDTQAGKIVDELDRLGVRDNTLIFYVFSDNGASAEGTQGTITDAMGVNGVTVSPEKQLDVLNRTYGGLSALGGPRVHEHYNAAWAWAGESPFIGTKLVAGYLGGTRVVLGVSWPRGIVHDNKVRPQFHHVNDIAPTIYDVVGVQPPAVFNGVKQLPLDGVSMVYSFNDASAPPRKTRQYFETLGSRAEYADGWMASVFGPRKPWVADQSGLISWAGKLAFLTHQPWIGDTFGWMKWKPENDVWSLYDLKTDFSQAHDLAGQFPAKVAELKKMFEEDAVENHVNPVGASFNVLFKGVMQQGPATGNWHFPGNAVPMSEFAAPNIKSRDNRVTVEAEFPANPHGVLFAIGGISGGISLYVDKGVLTYEYNSFGLTRTHISAPWTLGPGHATVEAQLDMQSSRRGGPAKVILRVNGAQVAEGIVPVTIALAGSAGDLFGVGKDAGTGVSLDYIDRVPFAFNGKISDVHVVYQ